MFLSTSIVRHANKTSSHKFILCLIHTYNTHLYANQTSHIHIEERSQRYPFVEEWRKKFKFSTPGLKWVTSKMRFNEDLWHFSSILARLSSVYIFAYELVLSFFNIMWIECMYVCVCARVCTTSLTEKKTGLFYLNGDYNPLALKTVYVPFFLLAYSFFCVFHKRFAYSKVCCFFHNRKAVFDTYTIRHLFLSLFLSLVIVSKHGRWSNTIDINLIS